MEVKGKHYRTIWIDGDSYDVVKIIDQALLPFEFSIKEISTSAEMVLAIKDMHVRGAGLIGAAGAYGMYLAACEAFRGADCFMDHIRVCAEGLKRSRPTAINLEWAVNRVFRATECAEGNSVKLKAAFREAQKIADEDADSGRKIGVKGLPLIESASRKKNGKTVNILTHCNAGWLALVDYGTALSPIYAAHKKDINIHVWVDETRPRNQGAFLTAWELSQAGVPHTVITDNEGGLLMQKKMVDMVIVGSDRTTHTGDVANKIGTYLKALAAADNNIPFYVAVYSSSFDWLISNGLKDIPIEQRSGEEVRFITGVNESGEKTRVAIVPAESPVSNYSFDITPAKFVTALITDRGICKADKESIASLFPDKIIKQ